MWCERLRNELRLDRLTLQSPPGGGGVQIRLDVAGITDPLLDPRVPQLVADVRQYRHRDDVALYSTDAGWRIALNTGEPIAYRRPTGDMTESVGAVAEGLLESIARHGGVLSDLFPNLARAAG